MARRITRWWYLDSVHLEKGKAERKVRKLKSRGRRASLDKGLGAYSVYIERRGL